MVKKIISILYIFSVIMVSAEEYSGSFISRRTMLELENGQMDKNEKYFNNMAAVYLKWRASTLLGEPIVNSMGVVVIPQKSEYLVEYENKEYMVPFEEVKKISVLSGNVTISFTGEVGGPYIDFDMGAGINIYFEKSDGEFYNLSESSREKYMSFNVEGSPAWNKLFYKYNISEKEYLKIDEAKNFFKRGLKSEGVLLTQNNIRFNLQPVYSWIKKREKKNGKKEEQLNSLESEFGVLSGEIAEEDKEVIKKIESDITKQIKEKCGYYYTSVRVEEGLKLSRLNDDESMEEREEAERKEESKRDEIYRRLMKNLPENQEEWRRKREEIRGECRNYIFKKYFSEVSTETIEKLLNEKFSSTKEFEAVMVYYY